MDYGSSTKYGIPSIYINYHITDHNKEKDSQIKPTWYISERERGRGRGRGREGEAGELVISRAKLDIQLKSAQRKLFEGVF